MPDWVAPIAQLLIAVIAIAALVVSIRAERRVSRLGSMSFPGVIAKWKALHKAGPREGMPPLERDMHEVRLVLSDRALEFSLADVTRTRWDEYWNRYPVDVQRHDDGSVTAYITPFRGVLPEHLMVKVERRGGVQASCWQRVRIEGGP